ncbi:hypothetical protein K440DRAFT_424037 [Wilcoxina mikolae CBS 423.85]|nr:hypothetical protein K440DRAFT_424037 [Wilcoxina mikolae CBS 423.85]
MKRNTPSSGFLCPTPTLKRPKTPEYFGASISYPYERNVNPLSLSAGDRWPQDAVINGDAERFDNECEHLALAYDSEQPYDDIRARGSYSPISTTAHNNTPNHSQEGVGGWNDLHVQLNCVGDGVVDMEDLVMRDSTCTESGTEICFGMLREGLTTAPRSRIQNTLSKLYADRKPTFLPISLGSALFILDEVGGYIGMLDKKTSTGVKKLLHSCNSAVRLQLFIPLNKDDKEEITDTQRPGPISLSINIYGPRSLFDQVGRLLSDHGLFLQRPENNDHGTPYENPHYFVPRSGLTHTAAAGELVTLETRRRHQIEDEVWAIFETAVIDFSNFNVNPGYGIKTSLKEHQRQALYFMQQRESENPTSEFNCKQSLWKSASLDCGVPLKVLGGILADSMGLGKSLSSLALITSTIGQANSFAQAGHGSIDLPKRLAKTTLLITPTSTLYSWAEQIEKHLHPDALNWCIYHGPRRERSPGRLAEFDLVITTYGTVRSEMIPAADSNVGESALNGLVFFRLILDEAHTIREQNQQFRAIHILNAQRRWCLSGTPIQNKLQDFGSLLRFLRVGPDNGKWFQQKIVNPIDAGSPEGLKRLRILVSRYCLRRTKSVLEVRLPAHDLRIEKVVLTPHERNVYDACKKDAAILIDKAVSSGTSYSGILQSLMSLRLVCNHGLDLLHAERQERIQSYDNSSIHMQLGGFLPENQMYHQELLCSPYWVMGEPLAQHYFPMAMDTDTPVVPTIQEPTVAYRGPSSKVQALIQNLRRDNFNTADGRPLKSVVFSYWTKMLDLVEKALQTENMLFARFDGSSTIDQRKRTIELFRNDQSVNILLVTIGSGSVGLDFTAASRAHLLEPQWNPMAEQQAQDRIHRIGQQKDVATIRYIVKDSIEEYIQECQNKKLRLADISFAESTLKTWVDETRAAVLR